MIQSIQRCTSGRRQPDIDVEKRRQKVLAEALIRISGGAESLTLTHAQLGDDGAKRLAEALENQISDTESKVRWIHLDNNAIGDPGAECLGRVLASDTGIRVLDLDVNVISDLGAAAIASSLTSNNTLQELDLHFNNIGSAGAQNFAKALEVNCSLQTLSLHGNPIGDAGAASLAEALHANKTLRVLQLGSAGIGDEGATAFAKALEHNRTLWALHLESNQIGDEGAISLSKVMALNTVLGELWLLHNDIGEVGARELSQGLRKPGNLRRFGISIRTQTSAQSKSSLLDAFGKRHTLRRAERDLSDGAERLCLDGKKLGDEGISELMDNIPEKSQLKELHLKKNCISDKGIDHLCSALEKCTNMEKLSLGGNCISDVGVKALAQALNRSKKNDLDELDGIEMPRVRELDLENNSIGDIGAIRLAEVVENGVGLEKLCLNGNQIGNEAVYRLELARENSSIMREMSLDRQVSSVSGDNSKGDNSTGRRNSKRRVFSIDDLDTDRVFGQRPDAEDVSNVPAPMPAVNDGGVRGVHDEGDDGRLAIHGGDDDDPDGGDGPFTPRDDSVFAATPLPSLPDDDNVSIMSIKAAGRLDLGATVNMSSSSQPAPLDADDPMPDCGEPAPFDADEPMPYYGEPAPLHADDPMPDSGEPAPIDGDNWVPGEFVPPDDEDDAVLQAHLDDVFATIDLPKASRATSAAHRGRPEDAAAPPDDNAARALPPAPDEVNREGTFSL